MMKRILSVIFMCALLALGGHAELVTQKQAKRLATDFFSQMRGTRSPEPRYVYNGRELTTNRLFAPFYVFNFPSGGFVMVSAENKSMPILAYSLKQTFSAEKMPPALRALLRSYAWDIERIRYDSFVPHAGAESWTHQPDYIASVALSPLQLSSPSTGLQERGMLARNLVYGADAERLSSDIYTPAQWSEMMNLELDRNGSVVAALIDREGEIFPLEVYGHKGDFYRISFGEGEPDDAYFRLHATELYADGQMAALGYTVPLPEAEIPEEEPFALVTSFLAEQQEARLAGQRAIEESLMVTTPVLHTIGGGHYMVDLPEKAAAAFVYNLGGSLVKQHTYKGSDRLAVDIAVQPKGFYFLQIIGESGRHYGLKLIR